MNTLECKKLVAVLIAAFPASKFTPETVGVYERMLADLDYAAAQAAVERLIATARFLPTVAEIRDAALTMHAGETRPGGDAWGDVLRAIGRYGYARTPGMDFQFADPVIAECVRAMNWRELCVSENQQADRARFIELYDKLAAQGRRKQLSESLPAAQRLRSLQAAERQDQERKQLPGSSAAGVENLVKLVLKRGDAE
ncbi:MAG TPA: replicative helicase loader/inhibitor [Kofleriaceae bacterium]|nr:replicative helicase loader/inhibitor [Kofleriaceae bacterium]